MTVMIEASEWLLVDVKKMANYIVVLNGCLIDVEWKIKCRETVLSYIE